MGCFDEKRLPLLQDSRPTLAIRPGHSRRQDYAYKRNGTRNLFLFVEPKAGRRHVLVTGRRTKQDFAFTMRYRVDRLYPDAACIAIVLDNLNTPTYLALVETFGKPEADRLWARLCFHYRPPHGSWLNLAEIERRILSRQGLAR